MATIQPAIFIFLLLLSSAVAVRDTLTTGRPLFENETLISASSIFAFGFFTPNATIANRYLAVWYHSIPSHDVVWVANPRSPIPPLALSPFLVLSPNATLSLFATTNAASRPTLIWSSPSVSANSPTDAARLLDTGNLIILNDSKTPIWQSFDYPSDTILPGMFIGSDFRTGLSTNITSWSSPTDPTPGAYVTSLDLHGVPQLIVRKSITGGGAIVYWRGGPWLGNRFAGVPEIPTNNIVGTTFVDSADRVGYYTNLSNGRAGSLITRFKAISDGTAQRLVWLDSPGKWEVFWRTPKDQCDPYSPCGPFGICNAGETPLCSCPKAFRPKNPPRWALRDVSEGCVRATSLSCRDPHGFLILPGVKLPDTSAASAHGGLGLDGCRARCSSNCSCAAYSLADVTGSCILWAGTLDDMRFYSSGGQDLYVRVAAADVVVNSDQKSTNVAAIVAPVVGGLIAAGILIGCLLVRCSKKKNGIGKFRTKFDEAAKDRDIDLPLFDFEVVADATNNFSEENKLGEGGFGPVFKGMMKNGKEIAVKRLSNSSTQGTDEFKNEVLLIAKLQHRNLVLILGCCMQRQERILIYEYMPNKSLDTFLFDDEKKMLLNWQMRYHIIIGIARGLLYLHQDSVVRVIHRDLKASNILLNQEMVPKISDFGLARIFGGEDAKSKTKRVVGTYGYMSPEYLIDGIFSVKSDVFSFGVLVLEVISNQRNRGFPNSESSNHLLEQAWNLWKEDKALELVDESIGNTFSVDEVLRCIKVGLLCVQERPNDRPSMSSVFLMMTSDKEVLPEPKCPGFVAMRHSVEANNSDPSKQETESENVVTLSIVHGR